MTKKVHSPKIVHGRHEKKRGKTKCGLNAFRLPDGNHYIVSPNAMGQVTCAKCIKNNQPGVC